MVESEFVLLFQPRRLCLAEVLIRQLSKGGKSLDDFGRTFAGGPVGKPAVKPYSFNDVVSTLNSAQPYDWASFLTTRIRRISTKAPLGGIEGGGWKLAYTDTRSDIWRFREEYEKVTDLTSSIGFSVKEDATISDVRVTAKAYAAGVAPATKLIAVDGRQFTPDALRDALHNSIGSVRFLAYKRWRILHNSSGRLSQWRSIAASGTRFQ